MQKRIKYIPKKKFLVQQYKSFHTLSLKLHESYPDIEAIKKTWEANKEALVNQEQKVHEIIKSYNTYLKNQNKVGATGFFFLILNLIILAGLTFLTNPLNIMLYMGIAIVLSSGAMLAMFPFLGDVFKVIWQGENYQSLIEYRNKLKAIKTDKYDKGEPEKENKIATIAEKVKTEEQYLTPDLVESRNAAVWQVKAFRENADYWRRSFKTEDYENLRKEIYVLRDLLRNLRNAQPAEKITYATLIDEHLNFLNDLYSECNRNNDPCRIRKI